MGMEHARVGRSLRQPIGICAIGESASAKSAGPADTAGSGAAGAGAHQEVAADGARKWSPNELVAY